MIKVYLSYRMSLTVHPVVTCKHCNHKLVFVRHIDLWNILECVARPKCSSNRSSNLFDYDHTCRELPLVILFFQPHRLINVQIRLCKTKKIISVKLREGWTLNLQRVSNGLLGLSHVISHVIEKV